MADAAGIATAVAAGVSALSNMSTAIRSGHEARKTARAIIDKQQQVNLENWNLQNEYNSPTNYRKRLEAAGYNPLLMDLSGNANTAGTLQSPDVASAYNAGIGEQSLSINRMNALAGLAQTAAQTDLLRAQAKKTNAETNVTNKELEWFDLEHGSALKLQGVQIDLGISSKALTDVQRDKLKIEANNLQSVIDAQIGQIKANTTVAEAEGYIRNIDAGYEAAIKTQEFKNMCAQYDLTTKQAWSVVKMVGIAQINAAASSLQAQSSWKQACTSELNGESTRDLNEKLGLQYDANTGQIKFNLQQDKKYSDVERSVGVGTSVVNSAAGVLKALKPF